MLHSLCLSLSGKVASHKTPKRITFNPKERNNRISEISTVPIFLRRLHHEKFFVFQNYQQNVQSLFENCAEHLLVEVEQKRGRFVENYCTFFTKKPSHMASDCIQLKHRTHKI